MNDASNVPSAPPPVPQAPSAPPPPPHAAAPRPPAPAPRALRVPMRVAILGVAALAALVGVVIWLVTRTPAPARARSIGARLELAAGDVAVSENADKSKALSGTP